jgi:regulator of sigma E protease
MRMLGVSPWQELKIAQIEPGSVAERAGLQIGDRLARLDDTALTSYVTFEEALLAAAGRDARLEVARPGAPAPIALTLALPAREQLGEQLGVGFDPEVVLIHPTPLKQISDNVKNTFRTLWSLLHHDSDVGISKLSGPIGIARVFHLVSQVDIRYVLWFTIIVNVNLAIFNLLPLPVLDGGHMLFATIGKLRGRALPAGFIHAAQTAFVVALLSMMLYVSFFDVRRIARDARSDEPAAQEKAPAPAVAPEPAPAPAP